MAAEILFLLVILFIALNILDITTTTGIICCGIYGFIVLNNYRTIRLQAQD